MARRRAAGRLRHGVTDVPLSPREKDALATLEEGLRADDPQFAEVLDSGPQALPARPPVLGPRHVLPLVAALAGLAVVGTVGGERLGPVGLAAVTGVAVVPWLLWAVRSAEHRARSTTPVRARQRLRTPRGVRSTPTRILVLGALVTLAAMAVLPVAWQAAAGLTVMFGLLPLIAWLVLRRPERG